MKKSILIIDPQRDFCCESGTLYVKGANKDMERLAYFFRDNPSFFSNVFVSLDMHQKFDIAHSSFWVNSKKEHPSPFTIISREDVYTKKWRCIFSEMENIVYDYLDNLETSGKYPLCIWPDHCLIGSEGAAVHPLLTLGLGTWEQYHRKNVEYFIKGMNTTTEHYSVFRAEVPTEDPQTHTNFALIRKLKSSDLIFVAGEAASHCVANSIRDLVAIEGDSIAKKLVIVEDMMSAVEGFQNLKEGFLQEMLILGSVITQSDSSEFRKLLRA